MLLKSDKKTPKLAIFGLSALLLLTTGCTNSQLAMTDGSTPVLIRHDSNKVAQLESPTFDATMAEVDQALAEQDRDTASNLMSQIDLAHLNSDKKSHYFLAAAELVKMDNDAKRSLHYLDRIESTRNFSRQQLADYYGVMAEDYEALNEPYRAAQAHMALDSYLSSEARVVENRHQTWDNISQLTLEQLQDAHDKTDNTTELGWLGLAIATKLHNENAQALFKAVQQWQAFHPKHPANVLMTHNIGAHESLFNTHKQIALLLPLEGKLAEAGKSIRDGFMTAYFHSQRQHKPKIKIYNTAAGNESIQHLYQKALQDGADFVIGPLNKARAKSLASHRIMVPTLLLNRIDTNNRNNPQLFQFSLSPQDEAAQVAAYAREKGYQRALIIMPDSDWGRSVSEVFKQQWLQRQGLVVDELQYHDPKQLNTAIKSVLYLPQSRQRFRELSRVTQENIKYVPRRRKDFDAIFLLAHPNIARQIQPLLRFYYTGNLPIFATSTVYSGKANPHRDNDLNGITFADIPYLLNKTVTKQTRPLNHPRLYAMGMDAYQLTTQLSILTLFPQTTISGATGKLGLNPEQILSRELNWGVFKHGRAQKVS